jgi:hypothetical protein
MVTNRGLLAPDCRFWDKRALQKQLCLWGAANPGCSRLSGGSGAHF